VLDNNPDKVGGRLYGHRLRVRPPVALAAVDQPVVVLRTGVYDDEIAAQLYLVNPDVVLLRAGNVTSPRHRGRPGRRARAR